jgi:hypothetical protein
MKGSCPLKTTIEWVASTKAFGEDNTWELWMVSKEGILPEPVGGAFYYFAKENPKQAAQMLTKHIHPVLREQFRYGTSVLDMLDVAQDAIYQEPEFKAWVATQPFYDKIFMGDAIKRTPEKEAEIEIRPQTLEDLANEKPDLTGPEYTIDPVALQNEIRSNEIISKYGKKFQEAEFQGTYSIITSEEAQRIHQNSRASYKGEAVFLSKKTMYYVKDKINLNTELGDIALPILQLIRNQTNKVAGKVEKGADVFDKLFDDLMKTPEGQMLFDRVAKKYPEITNQQDKTFKEKVLVEAIKEAAVNERLNKGKVENTTSNKAFDLYMKNHLMFKIRGALRSRFGNTITSNKVKANTTVDELAEILSPTMKVETEKITAKQFEDFNSDLNKASKELMDAVNKDPLKRSIDNVLDEFLEGYIRKAGHQQRTIYRNKGFSDLRKELSDPSTGGYLKEMLDNLKYFRKDVAPEIAENNEKVAQTIKAKSLVNSLFVLEKTLLKINEYLDNLKAKPDEIVDKLAQIDNYAKLLDDWSAFVKDAEKHLHKAGVPRNSTLYSFVSRLSGLTGDGATIAAELKETGAVKTTFSMLKSFTEKITTGIDEEIARLKDIKGDEATRNNRIKDLLEEKAKYTYTEDTVRSLYKGELGDSNFWSNMFITYSDDPDPIVATFSLYLEKHMAQITSRAYYKASGFVEGIKSLMESVGISNSRPQDWMEKGFLMIDQKHGYKDGELISQDVVSFAQATKAWRFDMAKIDKVIEEARNTRDKERIKNAYRAKDAMEKVFNREYTAEYYEARSKLREESLDAYDAMEAVNADIAKFKIENSNDYDFFQNYDELTELLRKKKKLSSMYDDNNILKDAKGQAIAKALTEHTKRTSKFYKSTERPGGIQKALDAWILSAGEDPNNAGIPFFNPDGSMSPQFSELLDEWLSQNTVMRYTDEYYKLTNKLYEQIAELSKDLPAEYNLSEVFREKMDLTSGYKDNNGQFDPNLISDVKVRDSVMIRLKELDEQIEDVSFKQKNMPLGRALTPKELKAAEALQEVFAELSRIRYKEPSEYYLDIMNNYLVGINEATIDSENADTWLSNTKKVDEILKKNTEIKAWFDKNHIKTRYKSAKGETLFGYKRLDVWSIAKPIDEEGGPSYTQSTNLILNGKKINVPGVPTSKYFYTTIKDSYVNDKGETIPIRTIPFGLTEEQRTKEYVGKVIDNKGNYLPLNKEQALKAGVSTTYRVVDPLTGKETGETKSYINEDYYNMINDPKKKELLDKIYKYHLSNQVGTERGQKLYLDLPRIPVSSILEGVQRGTIQRKAIAKGKGIYKGMAATLSGKSNEEANALSEMAGDDIEDLANTKVEEARGKFVMARDVIDPFVDKIPVKGLDNIPIDQISYDVIEVLNFYMLQLETAKVLKEINPVAKAMLETLENTDKGINQLKAIRDKSAGLIDTLKAFAGGKKNEMSRTAAVRALYNREFQGQQNSEAHLDWLNKITATITGAASINYFALNLPSAIKNYWGILWQLNMEAVSGEYFDYTSRARAWTRSKKAMNEWSTRIWGGKLDTVDTQLIIHMDPMRGKGAEVVTKHFSRTFAKDMASLSWTYSPRKFMEMEGALQLFYSIMYHIQIDRVVDGRSTKIAYADAFEIKDGKLQLLDGVDPAYGISYDENGVPTLGDKFIKTQNIVHAKFRDLNGTFAKFEQPQAQKYFAYRLFAFMRRYFTSMFMHRFGARRANFALEEIKTGYYVEAVKAIGKTLISLGKELPFMSASEKRATMKMLADVAQIIIVSMIASLLFGWDPDDEDRFEKLRAKSGALGDDDFQLDGWLSNHALTLLLKTQAENQSFIPLPGLGLNNYLDFTSSTSLAFGPTITSWAKLMTDMSMHALPGENEDLFYKKDTGPYDWQKEGSAKIWNHLSSMLGFSGSQVDPVKGLQSFDTFSKR